jgi:hypothetical protein
MENQAKRSMFSVAKECLALWWAFSRGKEILMEDGRTYRDELSRRSRLFDRIGRLVLFAPEDMACHWDFFMVPGDRRHRAGYYTEIAAKNVHDNQTRVRVRELLSKKAAKFGVVVVLLGAFIAPRFAQHMTPLHLFSGTSASLIGASLQRF